jgi:hypothetical protein
MSQVNTELGRSSTASINLNETAVRTLAGVPSGAISMDNLRGKSAVTLGFNNSENISVFEAYLGYAGVNLFSNGSMTYSPSRTSGPTAYLSPVSTGAGSQYEARVASYNVSQFGDYGDLAIMSATVSFANSVPVSGSGGWVALSSNNNITLYVSQGSYALATFTLEIRKIGTTSPVISRSGTLDASWS